MQLCWRFICQLWECLSHLSTLSFLKHLPCLLFLFRNLFGNNWKDFWKHLGRVQQSMIVNHKCSMTTLRPQYHLKFTLEIFSLVDSNFSWSLGLMEEAWFSKSKQIEDENLSVFLFSSNLIYQNGAKKISSTWMLLVIQRISTCCNRFSCEDSFVSFSAIRPLRRSLWKRN